MGHSREVRTLNTVCGELSVRSWHCNHVIMSTIASQITSHTIVYSIVYLSADRIKALGYWPLWGEFTGDQWIPRTKGQWRGKCFHLMTSSWGVRGTLLASSTWSNLLMEFTLLPVHTHMFSCRPHTKYYIKNVCLCYCVYGRPFHYWIIEINEDLSIDK